MKPSPYIQQGALQVHQIKGSLCNIHGSAIFMWQATLCNVDQAPFYNLDVPSTVASPRMQGAAGKRESQAKKRPAEEEGEDSGGKGDDVVWHREIGRW